ncbi:hypothetical protein, partial [Mesorhizobium sp. M4B.F.Ca.ET.089.01.1.1]|uniref:hypothetical protein n=1 Tax=Mesorhizobium sp. M4B.F.Ca.ET.089.01.1.1 TaxID=2496662 RepID=UPI001AECA3E6
YPRVHPQLPAAVLGKTKPQQPLCSDVVAYQPQIVTEHVESLDSQAATGSKRTTAKASGPEAERPKREVIDL